MGKAINALINAADETSESIQGTRLVFLDFSIPKYGARETIVKKKNTKNPHERVATEVREVKYLRDGYVKEENTTRKIVLESRGFEIVKEVLVPRDNPCAFVLECKVVGSVTRDLRVKEEV